MEVKIGVQHAPRELVVDTDVTGDHVQELLAQALAADSVFTLTDVKGRTIIVPAAKVAYLEVGSSVVGQVGFRG
ncbi:DUF3107 domain-containing protein [Nocardioides ochotonae]|uniref:DUF3107 domain-containing protein n=1 Tax=Nocardioides ochotonae TaxID=2685869 RepID=UPI00140AC280|nr:DUF3107 domain-containing protein [Nocardioides ochotonae]